MSAVTKTGNDSPVVLSGWEHWGEKTIVTAISKIFCVFFLVSFELPVNQVQLCHVSDIKKTCITGQVFKAIHGRFNYTKGFAWIRSSLTLWECPKESNRWQIIRNSKDVSIYNPKEKLENKSKYGKIKYLYGYKLTAEKTLEALPPFLFHTCKKLDFAKWQNTILLFICKHIQWYLLSIFIVLFLIFILQIDNVYKASAFVWNVTKLSDNCWAQNVRCSKQILNT